MSEKSPKTPEELGITNEDWVNLAESLLISREITQWFSSGPIYELHKMQLEYLEKLFGIQQNPPLLDLKSIDSEGSQTGSSN